MSCRALLAFVRLPSSQPSPPAVAVRAIIPIFVPDRRQKKERLVFRIEALAEWSE